MSTFTSPNVAQGGTTIGSAPMLIGAQVAEFERFLIAALKNQQLARAVSTAHRAALSKADLPGISRAVAQQEQLAREMLGLEQLRDRLLIALGVPLRQQSGPGRATLRTLLARVPEGRRAGVARLVDELAALARGNQLAARALSHSSRSLLQHMQSLMAQVRRGLHATGTYTARGHAEAAEGAFTPAIAAVTMDFAV